MKRHIPGLHHENRSSEDMLEGVFLVRVDRAFIAGIPRDRSSSSGSLFSNPKSGRPFPLRAGFTAPHERYGNSTGSCGISAMTLI